MVKIIRNLHELNFDVTRRIISCVLKPQEIDPNLALTESRDDKKMGNISK